VVTNVDELAAESWEAGEELDMFLVEPRTSRRAEES
jgi:hypothetical protein